MTLRPPSAGIVGILGGGQLGQMLALAGAPLGFEFRAFDPAPEACASSAAEHFRGRFDDFAALKAFARGHDSRSSLLAATYEWENVPVSAAKEVASQVPVFFPPLAALEMAQDRLTQKNFLSALGLKTAPFEAVSSRAELASAAKKLGFPALLKTRREGYDGKGQALLRSAADVDKAWGLLGSGSASLILEGFVHFAREVSLIAVRSRSGEMAFYDLGENTHRDGILRITRAPLEPEHKALAARAEAAARAILKKLSYVGVLSIEFFQVGPELLINELATRVHNSGHWTQDGAATSQFENHLRAGLGLALGSTALKIPTAMINLIGEIPEGLERLKKEPGVRAHLYGKAPKPGRKLGHVNVPLNRLDDALALLGIDS